MVRRNIQLKLALRLNKRLSATITGIAICVTYLAGTIALVDGLDVATKRVTETFRASSFIVYEGDSVSESRINRSVIKGLENIAICTLLKANLSGVKTRVVAIEDINNILGLGKISGKVLIGRELALESKNITLSSAGKIINLTSDGRYSSKLLPKNWAIVPREVLLELSPEFRDNCSFLVVPSTNQKIIRSLEAEGLRVQQTVAGVRFFEEGLHQVENSLWGIVIISATIIILLVYSIMSVELRERHKDIKVLRALGAKRLHILSIFLFEALFISGLGSGLGVTLGIIGVSGLTSFSPLLGFESIVVPQVTVYSLGLPILVTMLAGIIGGIYPATKASKIDIKKLGLKV